MKIPHYIGVLDDGKKLELPPDAITQVNSILGKRGKGKSNLLAVMLEIFWSRGQSFVVLDPPAAHWGIRYAAGQDGKPTGPSGIDVLIIGGEHGDIPIEHTNGREAAQIIVEGDISAVVDMKQMSFTARQTWCADFADELFRINKTPRHIAFEEAQNFLPQQLKFDEQKRVLYAMEKLITEGRSSGLGATIASQRPALVNKNVLTQTDNLYQLMVIAPQDIDQAEEWLQHHVPKAELKGILDDLPHLKPGECWIVSPEWLHTLTKLQARWRVTYHSGRTPKPGELPVNVARFSVGEAVERLKKLFAAKQTERRQDVQDLAEAKKRIRELERELKARPVNKTLTAVNKSLQPDPRAIARAVKDAVTPYQRKIQEYARALAEQDRAFDAAVRALQQDVGRLERVKRPKLEIVPEPVRPALSGGEIQTKEKFPTTSSSGAARGAQPRTSREIDPRPDNLESNSEPGEIRGPHRQILRALAEFDAIRVTEPSASMVAAWLGVKATTGTFKQYLRDLRGAGLIEAGNSAVVQLSDRGRAEAPEVDSPATTEALLERAASVFGPTPGKILRAAHAAHPDSVDLDNLAENLGVRASTGTFKQYIRDLRTAKMIEKSGDGTIKAADWLFL